VIMNGNEKKIDSQCGSCAKNTAKGAIGKKND